MSAMLAPLLLFTEAYWLSPWDLACHVALREKGLPFSRSVASLPGTRVLEPLRDRSVIARTPTLQHGDVWIGDSTAIVEYLEDVFPPPEWAAVLPRSPRDRARARQISLWSRNELRALRRERPAFMMFYPSTPAPLGKEARAEADELVETAARLLAGEPEFLFDRFAVCDADLAFALQRLRRTGEPLSEELVRYADRVFARPSVAEYVNHPRPPNLPPEDPNTRR